MAAKSVVDRLEAQASPQLTVIRLNLQDPATAPLARQYGAQYTPTFVLLNGEGEILLRNVGAIDPEEVNRLLSLAG